MANTEERIRARMEDLARTAPDSIGNLFRLTLESAEPAGRYVFRCETAAWMRNVFGTLHGGVSAAILDQAMGTVVAGLTEEPGYAPTVQMQQYYHRPFLPGEAGRVVVTHKAQSGTLVHMCAELYTRQEPPTLCVSASAMYYILKKG